MSKNTLQETLNSILKTLERFPQGANFREIMESLSPSPYPRTLHRHLSTLIKEGRLLSEGKAHARRYHLPIVQHKPSKGAILTLSQKAKKIQTQVTRSMTTRPHVGYQRELLDDYQPNHTFYLSDILRDKLLQMGKTEDGKYPAGTYARQIFGRLMIDLAWNSSRLEGNTYSLLETEHLLEQGATAKEKDPKDTQMILNHKGAIEFLVDGAQDIKINRHIISNLHALLSNNLLSDSACGRLRSIPVKIGQSTYTSLVIPQLIEECFERLVTKAHAITDPFEQAFFLMVHLPYLQPFEDVNKRTSRLAANIPLVKNNLCPLSFIDVPKETYIHGLLGIYEFNQIDLLREIFVWAYERSCFLYSMARNVTGEPDLFRMQHQKVIVQTIAEIVRTHKNKLQAIDAIRQQARESIPVKDQNRFIETVERELQSLHAGSIARYRLDLDEYEAWQKTWK